MGKDSFITTLTKHLTTQYDRITCLKPYLFHRLRPYLTDLLTKTQYRHVHLHTQQ